MGKAGRDSLNKGNELPGPGSYSGGMGAFDPKKGVSMLGRNHPGRHSYDSPGPGSYDMYGNPTKQNAPAYKMGGRNDKSRITDGPGPGAYNGDPNKFKERSGVAGFGTGKRGYGKAADGPGPGAYTSPNKSGGPAYKMGGRHQAKMNGDAPGPGAYDGSIDAVREKAPGVKMGGGPTRGGLKGTDGPGPG